MALQLQIVLDRVGGSYIAGETVTGVVLAQCNSPLEHKGIHFRATGAVTIHPSPRQQGIFDLLQQNVPSMTLLQVETEIAKAGKLPAGETAIPFALPLVPRSSKQPLIETYQGVYVNVAYQLNCNANFSFSSKATDSRSLNVLCPGQAEPPRAILDADDGTAFSLTTANVRQSRRYQGTSIPDFRITGKIFKNYLDIDTPLLGFIRIELSQLPVTSVEIQLARAEYGATEEKAGRECTEVQNIQIGEGDVIWNFDIPIYMMFPKWYTCASVSLPNIRVEFEVNMVITFEGRLQVSQNVPLRLYRGKE